MRKIYKSKSVNNNYLRKKNFKREMKKRIKITESEVQGVFFFLRIFDFELKNSY
jgi:hypothetical protein